MEVGQQHSTWETCEQKDRVFTEQVEGRALTKRNTVDTTAVRTQGRGAASNSLYSIRRKAQLEKRTRFNNLFNYLKPVLLEESYFDLKRNAAAGIDEVDWKKYGQNISHKISDLHERLHSGSYRAQPVKRNYISKSNGSLRPLGITAVEDKIVQKAVTTILSQIYEVDFMGFSYGFREKRSQHSALDALYVGISDCKINYILDADISGFFDKVDHRWLMRFIEHRVADRRLLRLIRKWLRVGYIENGKHFTQSKGTPQGSVISPLLANIYLHYVQDLWANKWRNTEARGEMIIVRYVDDTVFGFQYEDDAKKFLKDLIERLEKFNLSLNSEKTRLIEFGRFAISNRLKRGQTKPDTFNFLGFTHSCSKTKDGRFLIRRKTVKEKFTKKYQEVKQELRERMHDNVKETGMWLRSVIIGYQNYYGVPGNSNSLKSFYDQTTRYWLKVLRRRSQKGKNYSWKRFEKLIRWLIPRARVVHPFPSQRFKRHYLR